MAEFGPPVAQNVAGPQQGLQTIAGIMGLKQQQLGIQQEQAEVGTAQAGQQQAAQRNTELQQAQALAVSAKNGAFRNKDGSLDIKALSSAIAEQGPYAAQYGTQIMSLANEMVQNSTAINSLNTKERAQAAAYLQSAIKTGKGGIPETSYSDVVNAMDGMVADNPQLRRLSLSVMPRFHPTDTPAQIVQTLKQVGAAFSGSPPENMAAVQTNRGIQYEQTNPYSPLGVGPQGAPVPNTITPQVVLNPLTHAPGVLNPAGTVTPVVQGGAQPQPAPNGAAPAAVNPSAPGWLAGTGAGWQPKPGQQAWIEQNTQALVHRAQAGINAANTSPVALDALNRMRAIMDEGTWTGGAFSGFKDLKNLAASLGVDTKTAQNASELAKNMARYEGARASFIGDTDLSKSLMEQGSPNYKMDPAAVKEVILQCMASERIIQSYANLMESSPNPEVGMQREQAFRSIPELLPMFELGEMRNPAEVNALLSRYHLSGATLAKSRKMYESLAGGG